MRCCEVSYGMNKGRERRGGCIVNLRVSGCGREYFFRCKAIGVLGLEGCVKGALLRSDSSCRDSYGLPYRRTEETGARRGRE